MAFTPGPWKVAESYGRGDDEQVMIHGARIGAMRQCIAITCRRARMEEQERIAADARLIAAAPDMHAGLESAYQLLARLGESGDLSVIDTAAVLSEAIRIREILSKAVT